MPTPAPRPRGDGSMKNRLREDRKDREQQRRQRVVIPKASPAPVAAAGGTLQGFTRAKPGSVIQQSGSYIFTGWTFDGTWSNFGAANTTPGLTSPAGQNSTFNGEGFNVTTDGWYWQRIRVNTDSSASMLQLDLNDGANGAGIDTESYFTRRVLRPSIGGGFDETVWCGPFWLAAKDGFAPLRFAALYPSGESPSHIYFEFTVDVIAGAR